MQHNVHSFTLIFTESHIELFSKPLEAKSKIMLGMVVLDVSLETDTPRIHDLNLKKEGLNHSLFAVFF